jgi:hypothetical protein
MPRRFPPPWTVEELDACFVVIDSAEQKLAYVYFEEESEHRSAAKLLTKDEARRIAANIAKPAVAQVLNRELQKTKRAAEVSRQLSRLLLDRTKTCPLSASPHVVVDHCIIPNTAATRSCWVIIWSGSKVWSDHHVVDASLARTNGVRLVQRRMMMMRLLRTCGAREHREDAKSRQH